MSTLEDRVLQTLQEYQEARRYADSIRGLYIASGSAGPDGKLPWPEKVLDATGIEEIQEADDIEQQKWNAHQIAIKSLRDAHRSN